MDLSLSHNSTTVSTSELFFRLGDPLANPPFRGAAEPHSKLMIGVMRAEVRPPERVRIYQTMGRFLRDFLWAERYPLIHDRVVDLLSAAGIRGWTTYPVGVSDKEGKWIAGYHGLAITGRCDTIRLDPEHSELVYKDYPTGRYPEYRGLWFPRDTWDGSDMFMAADKKSNWILVTEQVSRLFKKSKITNCRLTPISEIQMSIT